MPRTLTEIIADMPPEQRADVKARAKSLIEDEMTLQELRKARLLTQERLSEVLNISQDGVSRLEKRSDLLLSTLRSYVEAMGGKLRISAEFPNRRPVNISVLGMIASDGAKSKHSALR